MFPSMGKPQKSLRRRSTNPTAAADRHPDSATSDSTSIACFAQYLSVDDRLVSRLDNAAKTPDRPEVALLAEASIIVSQVHRLCLQSARFGLPAGTNDAPAATAANGVGIIDVRHAYRRYKPAWETRRCVVPMNAFKTVTAASSVWWGLEDSIVYAAALRHTVGHNGHTATHFQLIQSPSANRATDRAQAPAFIPGAMIGWWLSLAGSDAADYLASAPQPELQPPQTTWSPTLDDENMRGIPWLATGGGASATPRR
jgi:putative SOS response-associated peptidase YedK